MAVVTHDVDNFQAIFLPYGIICRVMSWGDLQTACPKIRIHLCTGNDGNFPACKKVWSNAQATVSEVGMFRMLLNGTNFLQIITGMPQEAECS